MSDKKSVSRKSVEIADVKDQRSTVVILPNLFDSIFEGDYMIEELESGSTRAIYDEDC